MTDLQTRYTKEIIPKLIKEFGISNVMAVPKLVKIVINCGLGEALKDKKSIEAMETQLAVITGQKPQVRRAKQAISTFKLRIGDPIGLKVTLRGAHMYDFFTKVVMIALPRVRDFHGVARKGFDGRGNYTLGIREQTIFPDLEYKMVDKTRGFEITLVTSAVDDKTGMRLLELMGMPFEKSGKR